MNHGNIIKGNLHELAKQKPVLTIVFRENGDELERKEVWAYPKFPEIDDKAEVSFDISFKTAEKLEKAHGNFLKMLEIMDFQMQVDGSKYNLRDLPVGTIQKLVKLSDAWAAFPK